MNRGAEEYDQDGDYAIGAHEEEFSEGEKCEEQPNRYPYNEDRGDEDLEHHNMYPYTDGDEEDDEDEYSNFYNEYEDGDEEDEDEEEDADEEEEERRTSSEGHVEDEEVEEIVSSGRPGVNGNSDRWVSSLQELLGTLAQGMEARRTGDETNGARRMNLSEVFPEYRQVFGMVGGGGRMEGGRMLSLMNNIVDAVEEPYVALESLREINEQLLMLNPLTAERVVPQLELLKGILDIMAHPKLAEELELQLMSCRCLYNLFGMNADMVSAAVERNVIPILQNKLVEISYIDLAEQVLETLEYISRLSGREILNSGCLVECLQYVDFFTIHAQRKAVTIVSNSCARSRPSDYDQIVAFFPLLKNVFITNGDQGILTKMLNALYSICTAVGTSSPQRLDVLVDLDVINRIVGVVSSTDIDLDGKLKSLDILSQLVSKSANICKQIIESCELSTMLIGCLNEYKKTPNTTLHEVLMFVPKQLLVSMSRFICLLLPTEEEQVLSIDSSNNCDMDFTNENFVGLVHKITPFLIEIYSNTVDFEIRRYILISLARIVTAMNSNSSYIDKHLIGMISSSIAHNKTAFENENEKDKIVSGGLLLGLLSLSSTMIAKCAADFVPAFKREGFLEMLKSLSTYLNDRTSYGDNSSHAEDEVRGGSTSGRSSVAGEEDEDDYDMDFGLDADIPDQVKPKKMRFSVFRNLDLLYIDRKLVQLCSLLTEGFSSSEESVINELKEVEQLVSFLHTVDNAVEDPDYWMCTWNTVKSVIFRSNFTISGFEFISTGLSDSISKIIKAHPSKASSCQTLFLKVFADKLELLIKILQSALTKLESFEIIDCGTSEGRAASLGKQMKIRLEYVGDLKQDNIPSPLSSMMVSIHCISSFKSLNDFLKHRVAQSRFLTTILPLSNISSDNTPDDVKSIKFEFLFNDEVICPTETIFGFVFKHLSSTNKDPSKAWGDIQIIKYRRIYENDDEVSQLGSLYQERDFTREELKPIDGILDILACCRNSSLDPNLFINPKIAVKLSRQLEEPLIVASGALPRWTLHATRHYSFLFPLDVRILFLQNTSFGYGRLIQLWKERLENEKNGSSDDQLQQLGRPTRHKLRISRENIFLSALKILSKYGPTPNILEIEYQDEVGTGMGPTLEFYAIVSKEFARKSLHLWHCDPRGEAEYVDGLLFPAPLSPERDTDKVLELFSHLGTFIARSMLDNRILDFRFNRIFFELMHAKVRNEKLHALPLESMLSLLKEVDPRLESSLRYVSDHRDPTSLQSFSLFFTAPGYNIELIENGVNIPVTPANVDLYLSKVCDAFLGTGIERQLDSFIEGFSKAFPYSSLLIFSPSEICDLYGRVEEDWSPETLLSCIIADHGYSMDSPTLCDLIHVMASFDNHQRRLFLQFLTGSPKLPIGGFKNLKPRLTVVLKHPEGDLTADQYLPSVMTCANYLKLPKYSSRDILRSRIIQAMQEGSGVFLLS